MKARIIGLITLPILLFIPLTLIDGSNQQELNAFDSFTSSTLLLPEIKQLLKAETKALPDATFVKAAPVFQSEVMRRPGPVMTTREAYLKMGMDGANRTLIKPYAIVPETIQLRDYRKKRKRLSVNEFNNV